MAYSPRLSSLVVSVVVSLALAVGAGCAGVKAGGSGSGAGGSAAPTGQGGGGGSASPTGAGGAPVMPPPPPPCPNNLCTDFPSDPIIDPSAPANPQGMFAGNPTGAGPCVTEPEDGALFPNNWLRPRFKWTTSALVRITITASNQSQPLVAYTMSDNWKMPKDIWTALAGHTTSTRISVEVRAAGGGATSLSFQVAPVPAGGSMVFWAANPMAPPITNREEITDTTTLDNESKLYGFTVGDESTTEVLKISQVQQQSRGLAQDLEKLWPVRCIGCHVGMPDAKFVAFLDCFPWRGVIASVAPGMTGATNPGVTAGGIEVLRQDGIGIQAYSPAHWATGDRIAVVPYANMNGPAHQNASSSAFNNAPRLAWLNLEAPPPAGWNDAYNMKDPIFTEGVHMGFIARNGDARGASTPAWTKDGNTIVYASTVGAQDSRLNKGDTDLYVVPYNNRMGGDAKPLAGAATTTAEEYYPAISPDDKIVAFTHVPAGECMYANPDAEVAVVPIGGGTVTPLVANTPPACSGAKSPGVNNHWARWSPAVKTVDGKTYYWLIFSSTRTGLPGIMRTSVPAGSCFPMITYISQLYVTGLVVDESGSVNTFPAIYVWNQPPQYINTTPAWEDFVIPIVQ
jgi:hypothetical protein